MPYYGKKDPDSILDRRNKIVKIKEHLMMSKGQIYWQDVVEELQKQYGIYIDKATFYRDDTAINMANTFVLDLAKYNYSAIIERCFNMYDEIIHDAHEIQHRRWTNSKHVRKEIKPGAGSDAESDDNDKEKEPTVIEEWHQGDELATPKLQALTIKLNATNAMVNFLKGSIIDTSFIMMEKELVKVKLLKDEFERKYIQAHNQLVSKATNC